VETELYNFLGRHSVVVNTLIRLAFTVRKIRIYMSDFSLPNSGCVGHTTCALNKRWNGENDVDDDDKSSWQYACTV